MRLKSYESYKIFSLKNADKEKMQVNKIMNNPIIMHINYFEKGQTFEYVCRKATEMGYDGIEVRSRGKGGQSYEDYLDTLKRHSEKYRIKHILFGEPCIDVSEYDNETLRAQIDGYKRFLELADSRFNLKIMNFTTGILRAPDADIRQYDRHGSFYANDSHWEAAAIACREIADFAPHIKFALETHPWYIHDLTETTLKLCDMIGRPNFGVNLDFGNVIRFEPYIKEKLEDSIDACGPRLFYIHMKNSIPIHVKDPLPGAPRRIYTSLADGEIDHRAYARKLCAAGYEGFICVECTRPGDREWYAREDAAYLKSVMESCCEE